jgi:cyclase
VALKRVIPCLLYDGSGLVKTVKFKNPAYIGDPINALKIYNEKEVDELVLLDIDASKQKRQPNFDRIADMAGEAFMPFAYGGGVKSFQHFSRLYRIGVEKVVVNSLIQENPDVIRQVIAQYGAQSVVGCIDYGKSLFGGKVPRSHLGHKIKGTIVEYARFLEKEIGVGEIMLQSIDRDGTWSGYDEEVNKIVIDSVGVPVIVAGGCGSVEDIRKALYASNASAAAVGSMAVYSKKGMGILINFPERNLIIIE